MGASALRALVRFPQGMQLGALAHQVLFTLMQSPGWLWRALVSFPWCSLLVGFGFSGGTKMGHQIVSSALPVSTSREMLRESLGCNTIPNCLFSFIAPSLLQFLFWALLTTFAFLIS